MVYEDLVEWLEGNENLVGKSDEEIRRIAGRKIRNYAKMGRHKQQRIDDVLLSTFGSGSRYRKFKEPFDRLLERLGLKPDQLKSSQYSVHKGEKTVSVRDRKGRIMGQEYIDMEFREVRYRMKITEQEAKIGRTEARLAKQKAELERMKGMK